MSRPAPPITEEDINAVKDIRRALALAKRFPTEVSLKKCTLPKMKERLRLAVQKWNGEMKDIDSLCVMMTKRREEDKHNRAELLRFYEKMKACITCMDENMKRHIGMEFHNINDKISMFIKQLSEPADKLVVAGETSSGKSTLLNIFLNDEMHEEMLPVKLLSCTATMCEINWGEERQAKTVTEGKETEILFNERHKYIYKESERESRFPHDLVRLQMPVPFLKSGVSLIDSPGIGENTEMGNVVKDFVMKNDVFGFLFTVASNRAGGVLNKFLNLLRSLASADYVDKYGQKKLDPHSCIFVANFWDEVPEENKVETKEHIFKTLKGLPFMRGFDPEKQIFFMDANFAYNSKSVGYISTDFAEFIDGLGNLVWEEQKRKLKASYDWIENAIQRILHPVKGFIINMTQPRSQRKKNKSILTGQLDNLEKKFLVAMEENKCHLEKRKMKCSENLMQFMKSAETAGKMRKWKIGDMPTDEPDDNWVLIEMKLDAAIDERVSDLMQEWEKETKCITNAEQELTQMFTYQFEVFTSKLEVIEREIRSTSYQLQSEESDTGAAISEMVHELPVSPRKAREFNIAFGQTHGSNIMGRISISNARILGSVSSGPTMKVLKNRFYKEIPSNPTKGYDGYRMNKLQYMEKRAMKVFEGMCNEMYIASVVTDQLKPIENFLTYTEQTTLKVFASNRNLVHQIAEETRNKEAVEDLYHPIEEKLVGLFEEVLQFGSGFMIGNDFQEKDFEQQNVKYEAHSLFAGHAYNEFKPAGEEKPVSVTLWRYGEFGIPRLRLSDIHSHIKFLRQFKRHDYVAQLLGIYNLKKEPILVLDGHLSPARKHLLKDHALKRVSKVVMQTQLGVNMGFLQELGHALLFLHLKKLVHCEFSLDSVMVMKGNPFKISPLLCNISEPTSVTVTQHKEDCINHYIHIPVEVLNGKVLYTQESDMFGLGIIMLELWYQRDVFADLKKSKKYGIWSGIEDPGEMLIEEAKNQTKKNEIAEKLPKEWEELAQKCLHRESNDRIGIGQWLNEFVPQMYEHRSIFTTRM